MAKVNKTKRGKTGASKAKGVKADNKTHKVSDIVFWQVLEENGGLYTYTARALEDRFPGLSYGRSAVQQRAERNPERLEQIREIVLDDAEEALRDIINDKRDPFGKPARVKAAIYLLDKRGSRRGYHQKPLEISASTPGDEAAGEKPISLTIKIAQ